MRYSRSPLGVARLLYHTSMMFVGTGSVLQHPERFREPSLVSTDGTCTPGRATPDSEQSDRLRTTSSTAVSEDVSISFL